MGLTASISTRPNVVLGAIKPGYTCFPVASIIVPLKAIFELVASATAINIPFSKVMILFFITPPLPIWAVAPDMVIILFCKGAGVCCAKTTKLKLINTSVVIFLNIFIIE